MLMLVLIVPLWNWNHRMQDNRLHWTGSNCTFMELKLVSAFFLLASALRSNCTFMELKFRTHREEGA